MELYIGRKVKVQRNNKWVTAYVIATPETNPSVADGYVRVKLCGETTECDMKRGEVFTPFTYGRDE